MNIITHRQLCEIGAKFLKNAIPWYIRCNYVVTEFTSQCSESPDIYGYRGGSHTVLIEVKVSRGDFFADRKKRHRQPGMGIGSSRYYLCPTNLIRVDELPPDWGLLYCNNEGLITIEKQSEHFDDRDYKDEMAVMYSIIRRLAGKRQVFDFKNQETLQTT